jgi:caffeoyl-CoA O-methyltransferase
VLASDAIPTPIDFIFIDAGKEAYPQYLEWAISNLRPGGMVVAHNAFRDGAVLEPATTGDHAVLHTNQTIVSHPLLDGYILAIGDGLAAGVRRAG